MSEWILDRNNQYHFILLVTLKSFAHWACCQKHQKNLDFQVEKILQIYQEQLASTNRVFIPQGCCSRVPQTECFKQQTRTVSQFCRLGVHDRGIGEADSFWALKGEPVPCLSPSSQGFAGRLWGCLACRSVPLISAFIAHSILPLHLFLWCLGFLSLKSWLSVSHGGSRPTLVISFQHDFLWKDPVSKEGHILSSLGFRASMCLFWGRGHNSAHNNQSRPHSDMYVLVLVASSYWSL